MLLPPHPLSSLLVHLFHLPVPLFTLPYDRSIFVMPDFGVVS